MLIRVPLDADPLVVVTLAEARAPAGVTLHITRTPRKNKRSWSLRGVLRTADGRHPYARRSASGRRTNAADWFAHRDFLDALFLAEPRATVQSALATYRGRADFLAKYPATAHHEVRAPMHARIPFAAL